ncbi:putative Myosin heavy chain-like protein [Melia azedarach]|uniref:Myosin heavy chain-like protein n=1 Tax=Melia azedarach TaxID=155640 RepID=A0ACC1X129_MELAZ|nr:putative Myosin heavy chain-like protein [Melia azedarach]
MFRLHKTSRPTANAKSRERIDFKFSNFKALQVPKGWDKLFVSITSSETGKTIAKSSKALVRNGTCHWTDNLSESIWVSEDVDDLEHCLFKLVVAMGSARSGILGEITVNMTSYMSSTAVVLLSFPLKKCNYGTILQVKIHCLTPRRKLRENESKDLTAESHDVDIKSDGFVHSIVTSNTGSSCSTELGSASHKEQESRGDNGYEIRKKLSSAARVDAFSKIQLLEAELAKTMEANSMYKAQLSRAR